MADKKLVQMSLSELGAKADELLGQLVVYRAQAASLATNEESVLDALRRVQEEVERRDPSPAIGWEAAGLTVRRIEPYRRIIQETIDRALPGTTDVQIAEAVEEGCREEVVWSPGLLTLLPIIRSARPGVAGR